MFAFDRTRIFHRGEGGHEIFAVIMIAHGAMHLHSRLAQGRDETAKRLVVLLEAFEVHAVAIDHDAEWLLANLQHLVDTALEVFRHARIARDERRIGGDVGV